jgi:hypothetical protein
MNRSTLFAAYNHARRAAAIGQLERGRLNRALGLAMRRDQTPRYVTTLAACSCPDHWHRGPRVICAHRLKLMLLARAGGGQG